MKLQRSLILITAACLLSGTAIGKQDELPAVSHDGLELRKGKAAVVYVRPGVDFSGYRRFAILECPVAFSKDWERERKSGAARVSQKDMDEMKADLSAEFLKIFTDELQNKGGYQDGGAAHTMWWNGSKRECLAVATRDGRVDTVEIINENNCN